MQLVVLKGIEFIFEHRYTRMHNTAVLTHLSAHHEQVLWACEVWAVMILVDSSNVLCASGCQHHLGWRRTHTHTHSYIVFPASWTSPRILADVPGAPLSVSIVTSWVFFCLSSPFPLSPLSAVPRGGRWLIRSFHKGWVRDLSLFIAFIGLAGFFCVCKCARMKMHGCVRLFSISAF